MTPTPSARQDAAQIDAALGEDCLHDPGRAKAECVACRKIVLEMVLTAARAEGRQEIHEVLTDYCNHHPDCILSRWQAGRPTPGGGYEMKYRDQWYQVKPENWLPPCTCGLDAALRAEGKG